MAEHQQQLGRMLNLNTNNDYSMSFPHHLPSSDQQFYHNLYTNVSAPPNKDKNDFSYKNQKFDFINNNSAVTSEIFNKDSENSKRFSVNNLLKSSSLEPVEKLNGKQFMSFHLKTFFPHKIFGRK